MPDAAPGVSRTSQTNWTVTVSAHSASTLAATAVLNVVFMSVMPAETLKRTRTIQLIKRVMLSDISGHHRQQMASQVLSHQNQAQRHKNACCSNRNGNTVSIACKHSVQDSGSRTVNTRLNRLYCHHSCALWPNSGQRCFCGLQSC